MGFRRSGLTTANLPALLCVRLRDCVDGFISRAGLIQLLSAGNGSFFFYWVDSPPGAVSMRPEDMVSRFLLRGGMGVRGGVFGGGNQ